MNRPTFVQSVRKTDREVRQMLWRMAKDAERRASDEHERQEDRIYRQLLSVPVAIKVSEEAHEAYRAPLLDLSGSGAGFVFGRFVHPGAVVKVALHRLDKEVEVVYGTVRWCRLHHGSLHRVGVQWDNPIEIEKFSLDAAVEQAFDGCDEEGADEKQAA